MLTDYQTTIGQLAFAKQKLFAQNIPHRLKAISYLRICCSAMKKLDYFPSSHQWSKYQKTPYLSLLKSLSQRDPQWWNHCQVSDQLGLTSNDPTIDELLQPVNVFVESFVENRLNLSAA